MYLTLRKLKVLVVEDITPMRQLITDLLTALNIGTIETAQDGEEGYKAYVKHNPDIILTDWKMPKMDGLEMVRKIRRDPKSPNRSVPIIMITGFSAIERISEARDSGINEFLAKPFSANDIAKRIDHIIRSPRDFIVLPHFIGPDRRRKQADADDNRRTTETDRKISTTPILEQKTGRGTISPDLIINSQKVIDNNTIDFQPLARMFLDDLGGAINYVKKTDEPQRKSLERLIYPIMQIKANARIFNYALVGDLAHTLLNFLENLSEVNEYVLEIIEANQKTLRHLVDNNEGGDKTHIGSTLKSELENACARYMHARSRILQEKLASKDNTSA